MTIDLDYTVGALQNDPEFGIYRDILQALATFSPNRTRGEGLAYQTLFVQLAQMGREYEIQDIILACEAMRAEGVVDIKNEIFVHPTEDGEGVIERLFPEAVARTRIRPFPARRIA